MAPDTDVLTLSATPIPRTLQVHTCYRQISSVCIAVRPIYILLTMSFLKKIPDVSLRNAGLQPNKFPTQGTANHICIFVVHYEYTQIHTYIYKCKQHHCHYGRGAGGVQRIGFLLDKASGGTVVQPGMLSSWSMFSSIRSQSFFVVLVAEVIVQYYLCKHHHYQRSICQQYKASCSTAVPRGILPCCHMFSFTP